MVTFELGKEIKKDIFRRELGTKKKSEFPIGIEPQTFGSRAPMFYHRGSLCSSVVEHRSARSEGLRFDSSWGIRIFSLSQTREKTRNIFL